MLATTADMLDYMVRLDGARTDAQRSPEALLPLRLWERDRLSILAWMFSATGLKPKLSTLLISEAIVSSLSPNHEMQRRETGNIVTHT